MTKKRSKKKGADITMIDGGVIPVYDFDAVHPPIEIELKLMFPDQASQDAWNNMAEEDRREVTKLLWKQLVERNK